MSHFIIEVEVDEVELVLFIYYGRGYGPMEVLLVSLLLLCLKRGSLIFLTNDCIRWQPFFVVVACPDRLTLAEKTRLSLKRKLTTFYRPIY